MPNTIAHIGVNGFLSKPFAKNSELLWIYTGCLIPDFPWITMRIADIIFTNLNGYDIKTYAIAQASLFLCLVLSASFAALSKFVSRTFLILSAGSFLHLLLDALQIKWANGINLFAPISWELTNFNLFWPENELTYILSVLGIVFLIINWKNIQDIRGPFKFSQLRILLFILLLTSYFSSPFLMMEQIEESDLHYLSTLRDYDNRTGKYVELDRKIVYFNDKTDSYWINAYDGQVIELSEVPELKSDKISVRGIFMNKDLIEVIDYHENWFLFRDGSSYAGIFLIGIIWIFVLFREFFS